MQMIPLYIQRKTILLNCFISKDKLRIIMKTFIESQFNYCPFVWMFHNRTMNNKINRLHERALGVVYNDEKNDKLSLKDLLDKDGAMSIVT